MTHPSIRRWHIIDDEGRRPVLVDTRAGAVRSGVGLHDDPGGWPRFTQFAADAPADAVVEALDGVLDEFELPHSRTHTPPDDDRHVLVSARRDDATLLTEPGIPFDQRFLTAASSEALVERLGANGVHFGHEPGRGTLYLTRFVAGEPAFSWCDSLRPGPSFALDFHVDGRCTESDPRQFAAHRLGLGPEAETFDRYAFMQSELLDFGLRRPDPDLVDTDVDPVFELEHSALTPGGDSAP